jgi:dolichol-phosphate mannosyltransferase
MVELSVVTPVYGCADCLRALHQRLTTVLSGLTDSYEIILVDDRSPDGAWSTLQELAAADPHVRAFRLSRNFGQHAAITAGLARSTGRWTVVMDCDLQDPPEHIVTLYETALSGYEVVLSRRHRRVGHSVRRSTGHAYYLLHNLLTAGDIYTNYTNFSILSRKAVQAFLTLGDQSRQYLLIVHWIGFERTVVDVEVSDRHSGSSSYNLRSLLRVAADGIFFSTTRLLRWIVVLGFFVAAVGAALATYTIVKYLAGSPLPDWAGVSVLVLLASGFIICSTGVSGLYVGKIFDQVKARPLYLIDETTESGGDPEP